MGKLVIVGTVAFDAIETPFGKTDKILGGAGTFIGLAASNFNVDSTVVSVVGGDFPQDYLDLLANKNIDISGIEIVKDGKTFFWSGKYHNDMNSRDTLATELNVLADFEPKVPKDYQNADVVMLGNLHPLTQMSVLNQMTSKPKLVVLDTMNFWMDCALEDLHNTIESWDIHVLSKDIVTFTLPVTLKLKLKGIPEFEGKLIWTATLQNHFVKEFPFVGLKSWSTYCLQ